MSLKSFQVNTPFPGGPAAEVPGGFRLDTSGGQARLPCIWKENCSNQFISIDAKGTVAQWNCWVTSYPESEILA